MTAKPERSEIALTADAAVIAGAAHGSASRKKFGRIEVLNMIEAELNGKIQWINEFKRKSKYLGERMDASRYAYRQAIKIVRKYHVIYR